jgi:hypothetical protein
MSNLATASVSKTVPAVIDDLRSAWKGLEPAFIAYFASPALDPSTLAAEIKTAFPAAVQIGCTSAGEIVSGRMLKGGLAALALPRELAGASAAELATSVRTQPDNVLAALERLAARFDRPARALDHARHLGLVLIDGLGRIEERVMDLLGNACDVRFVGGSAGDDLQFRTTHVAVDGQAVEDGVVLALLSPPRGFDLIKTQSFRQLPTRLVATKVDETNRTVLEFDGRPAAGAYATALGVTQAELAKHFLRHPVGLMVDGDPFVRSPMRLEGDGVVFYCNIKQGMELSVLESTDIVRDTAAAIAAQRAKGEIAALLNFNCILRTLELEERGQTSAYGEVFSTVPTAGFSTYGEELIGHMNQTATIVSFRA